MFLKQVGLKPRSLSQSSTNSNMSSGSQNDTTDSPSSTGKGMSSSNNSQPGATSGGSSATPTGANNSSGGRRKSSQLGSGFAGLSAQKRGSDPETIAKKAGFMEQKPGSQGPIASMWSNFTKGPTGAG